ncbi:MFS transporter [Cronobacter sakazakii]|uniref:MFS transporter n=1 Tax=Cronobacter sakazakii TaxID=28141 RepID=UPI0029CA82A7|nr:MFS transporter [Cronobacter sakazakii]
MRAEVTLPVGQQNRNIFRLATAQALAGANSVVFYATGAIVGDVMAPDKALATLPLTIFVVGMAALILPFGALARRYGRRAAFMAGTSTGVLTGLTAAFAVVTGSFWLFCIAGFMSGAYAAVAVSFRFAATDGVARERRARALSLVMGGGVAAGIVGPMLVNGTMNLWPPYTFAATYLAQALVAALSAVVLWGVKAPDPVASEHQVRGRPLRDIVHQPGFSRTVFSGAVAYMVMNFLMTATPLSMHMHGLSLQDANLGIQWHVIAMYAPGFFTGKLITRFGATRIAALGLAISALSVVAGLAGTAVGHYWLLLILLGFGWNFGFTGASAQILDYHRPEEKNRVQSLNDFVVFGVMIVGSFSSGALLTLVGWNAVLWCSLVPLVVAMIALLAEKRRAAASLNRY